MRSKLSSKSKVQATIPLPVRKELEPEPGDFFEHEVQEVDSVTLRKVEPIDVAFHQALESTLDEWVTPEDEEEFRDL